MRPNAERYSSFRRRGLILGIVSGGLMGMLGARLYWLQSIEAEKYRVLAEGNRLKSQLLTPSRGLIYDRTGVLLAANQDNFQLFIAVDKARASASTKHAEAMLQQVGRVIDISDDERQRILSQMRQSRNFEPVMVSENLSWDQMAQIEFNAPDLPGVKINLGQTRAYHYSALTSHIVGYVGRVSPEDLRNSDEVALQLPDMRIGKRGIEKGAEKALRGRVGVVQLEVNAAGRAMRELSRAESEPGSNLLLTIDMELQQFVAEQLKNQSASATVMDVITGDILAMVSVPSFDNNLFARGITKSEWQMLLSDPKKPLLNKAAQGVYPPGSTYKMVTALAALESQSLTLSDRIFCGGSIDLPGKNQKKYCWIHPGGHGWLNVVEALQQSCDVFFYEAAKRAGVNNIVKVADRLGFGKPTAVGLPGESGGLLPSPRWFQEQRRRAWTIGDTYNLGIGQGDMLATPLQLAAMTARIANGGYDIKPRLVVATSGSREPMTPPPMQSTPRAPNFRFSPQNLRAVQKGMDLVVNSPSGTAFGSRIAEKGMAMAGKTGTSQVKRITESERNRKLSQQELPWELRHHALFCGYAPVENARYACAVVVEHGMGGSRTAAPIARDILVRTQELDPSRRPDRFGSTATTVIGSKAEVAPSPSITTQRRGSER
jgi:penicillin-binding protein 2